ncbi:MAG: mandelate racemase/muconate lactonizing enzyme family protein [Chitinophagaceae bacterium]|nr:mandelate racemase/muconate lactonizing enzyme family protein [Chitinophagaceae bacterium]
MKISNITCYEVMVPARPGMINSASLNKPLHKLPVGSKAGWSVQFDRLPKLIIRMELSTGIVGWGELYRNHDWRIVEDMIGVLLGKNLNALILQKLPFNFCREYDGFECAVWDAYAKAHNMRVADLLGGPLREKVKVGAWSGHRLVEEIGEMVSRFAAQGYDCIKFKCDLEDDVVKWCEVIADAAPSMKVILDPNERWDHAFEARKRIRALNKIGNLLCVEEPVPRWQLNEYASLRAFSPVPIVLHVSLPYVLHGQRIKDAIQAIRLSAVDAFNFNCGLADFQQLDHIASAAGMPCWHGSEIDLGILEAMYVHSSAAAASCTWPGDIFGRMIREHDLLKVPLQFEPPYVRLPEGPGLGVEPDEYALKHYQITQKEFH